VHGWGVPLQLDDVFQLQPYSPLQVVELLLAPQGVTVPTHVPVVPETEHPGQ
jgi:hypothetical protein